MINQSNGVDEDECLGYLEEKKFYINVKGGVQFK